MNARQLAIRTAAFARDYFALERLFDAGASAADAMHAVLVDVLRSGDAHLLELVLCSAPDLALETAFAIERNVRGSNAVVAMHIRTVFWKLLLVREMLDDEGAAGDESRRLIS